MKIYIFSVIFSVIISIFLITWLLRNKVETNSVYTLYRKSEYYEVDNPRIPIAIFNTNNEESNCKNCSMAAYLLQGQPHATRYWCEKGCSK